MFAGSILHRAGRRAGARSGVAPGARRQLGDADVRRVGAVFTEHPADTSGPSLPARSSRSRCRPPARRGARRPRSSAVLRFVIPKRRVWTSHAIAMPWPAARSSTSAMRAFASMCRSRGGPGCARPAFEHRWRRQSVRPPRFPRRPAAHGRGYGSRGAGHGTRRAGTGARSPRSTQRARRHTRDPSRARVRRRRERPRSSRSRRFMPPASAGRPTSSSASSRRLPNGTRVPTLIAGRARASASR